MKLMHRIWLVTAVALVVAMSLLGLHSYRNAGGRVEAEVLKTSQTLRDLLMTVRYTYHQRFLNSGLPLTDQTLGFLPAHAMSGISTDFSRFHQLGIRFRNVSERARNPENQADRVELAAIEWFRVHPDARERLVKIEDDGPEPYYFHATPIHIEPYCLTCHGDPANAPETVRQRYDSAFGYRAGELRGVLGIRVPAAAAEARVREAVLHDQLVYMGGVLLAVLVGGLLMHRLVIRRLQQFKTGALRLARGEYATRLDSRGPDEIVELAGAFNHMAAAMQQRESALRASERDFRALVQNIPGAVYRCKLDGNWTLLFLSDYVEILCGYPSSDFFGDHALLYADVIHPDDVGAAGGGIREAVARHRPYQVEYRIRHANGGIRWVLERGQATYDATGEAVWLDGVVTDVTPRKRAQAALEATAGFVSGARGEAFFPDLVRFAAETLRFDYVHVGLLSPDRSRVEILAAWLDGGAVERTGYALESTPCAEVVALVRRCIGSGVRDLYPEDADLASLGAESYVGEPLVDSAGGAIGLIVGITRAPLEDGDLAQANLRILAARAAAEHEQREALRALREARDRSQNYLDTVEAIIVALDRDGRVTQINRKGCQLLGYSEAELLGRDWFSVCLPEDDGAEDVRAVFVKALAADMAGAEYYENAVRARDGGTRLIAWHNSVLRADDGTVIGSLSAGEDITERKRAEQELRDSEIKFHTMVDWTHDWEYWVLPDGRFHYMTPSVERVTGYRVEDFERNPELIDAIVHPEDRHLWERHVHAHLPESASQDINELDMRIVRKQGDSLWVTHTCRPVFDPDGRYRGRRVTVRDISARKAAEARIHHLAYFDSLTSLPNRRLLLDRLGQALIASDRGQEYGAVLMLDLDHFKTLNDTRGHDVGDRLLIEVARRLEAGVRQVDTVARLGGDEYVVTLEGLGRDERAAATQAEAVAEKIRLELNAPYVLDGLEQEYHSTPSIGLTLFRGLDTPVEGLLKQADVALYQAKGAGRDTVRFFNPAMQAAVESRAALETALRHAIERDELRLYYQPQVDREGRVISAEALLRWSRPDHGLVSPAHFIPLAEETGLILPIGQWVLDTACAQLRDWRADPRARTLRLAINVSGRQFHQPDFVARVAESIRRHDIDPALLKLELTESVALENVEEVIARMRALRELGVGFSMDDFGTGYSSLSYLKRLPLDQLKIDQSFVRDLSVDPGDAAIVRAILAMSDSLGLRVVAEGVETPEQHEFLRRHGCAAFQGYLFGRPEPIGEWKFR